MMLGEKQDVAHSGLFGHLTPLIGIAARGRKIVSIFVQGGGPFFSVKGAKGPTNKHAKFHI